MSSENVQQARSRYSHLRVRCILGDVLRDLPSEQLDVVILSNVLEHLEHRVEFLRDVQEAIQPSCWLIRVLLFERHWGVPLKQELGMDYRLDPTHQIEYTQESFADEMQQAGLEIVHQEVRWGEIWAEVRRREGFEMTTAVQERAAVEVKPTPAKKLTFEEFLNWCVDGGR